MISRLKGQFQLLSVIFGGNAFNFLTIQHKNGTQIALAQKPIGQRHRDLSAGSAQKIFRPNGEILAGHRSVRAQRPGEASIGSRSDGNGAVVQLHMDGRIGIGHTANRDAVIIEAARAGRCQHQHRFCSSDGKYIHGFKTVTLAILAPQGDLMPAVFQTVQGNIAAAAPGGKVAVIQCIGAVLQRGIGRHLDGHISTGDIVHAVHGFLTGSRQCDFRFLSRCHGNGRRFYLVRGKKTAVSHRLEGTYTYGIRLPCFQTIGKCLGLYHRLGGILFRISFGSGCILSAHGQQIGSLVHLHIPVNGRLPVFIIDGDQITLKVSAGSGHGYVNGIIAAQCGVDISGSSGGVGIGIGHALLLCDGIGSTVYSGTYGTNGVNTGRHIGGIGQRNFSVIHLSQSLGVALIQNIVFAIAVICVNGQSAQCRQIACNRSGGVVYRDALQFRKTGHTVDAQLGCTGRSDAHFLTKK